jgi:hypothetical protein
VLLHFKGASWHVVPLPSSVPAQDVQMLTSADGWALQYAPLGTPNGAEYAIPSDRVIRGWQLQHGQWQPVAWPFSNIIAGESCQRVAPYEYWGLALAYDLNASPRQYQLGPPPGATVLILYVDGHFYMYGEPAGWSAPAPPATAAAGR